MIAWLSAAAHAACTMVVGGTVHLPSGPPVVGAVVWEGERIVAVGAAPVGLDVASGTWKGSRCDRVDATGRHVTPGLVEVGSQLGLYEIGLETGTHDDDPGGDPVRAAFRVAEAYNPQSVVIPVQRVAGITSALTSPAGARIAGVAALVSLDGQRPSDAIVAPAAAMVLSLAGPSNAAALLELREVFGAAREQAARRRPPFEIDADAPYGASALDLAALGPVLSGVLPVVVGVDRASDLWSVLGWAAEQKVRLVVSGGAEAWQVADVLAERGIPVIVDPLLYGPGSFDQLGARPDNAALLAAAGVPVILSSFSTHHARTLAQVAGNAVRAGLPAEDALRAITATPAAVFGAPERGRLAVGAVADVVLWSGAPLSLSSAPDAVWVEGRATSMVTRQSLLRERYRTLPGTPRAPLPTP